MQQSPETIYKYYKDAFKDLEKAKKRNKGLGRTVRMALGLRSDIKVSEAQRLHDNQLKYSEVYADDNLDTLFYMAKREDSARYSLEVHMFAEVAELDLSTLSGGDVIKFGMQDAFSKTGELRYLEATIIPEENWVHPGMPCTDEVSLTGEIHRREILGSAVTFDDVGEPGVEVIDISGGDYRGRTAFIKGKIIPGHDEVFGDYGRDETGEIYLRGRYRTKGPLTIEVKRVSDA